MFSKCMFLKIEITGDDVSSKNSSFICSMISKSLNMLLLLFSLWRYLYWQTIILQKMNLIYFYHTLVVNFPPNCQPCWWAFINTVCSVLCCFTWLGHTVSLCNADPWLAVLAVGWGKSNCLHTNCTESNQTTFLQPCVWLNFTKFCFNYLHTCS